MDNKVIILVLAFVLFSCNKQKNIDIVYTDIKNIELKNQIILYTNFIDSVVPYREKIILVKIKKINDSITNFEITNQIYDYSIKKYFNFNFISKIANRDIFFEDNETKIGYRDNYFEIDSLTRVNIIKRNFSKEYRDLNTEKNGIVSIWSYDPINFHLTFVNGKLINKDVQMGNMW